MDNFFSQSNCDRCGDPLTNGRTMSRFNTECICLKCAEEEKSLPGYHKAIEAENVAIRNGNFNFLGIRYNK